MADLAYADEGRFTYADYKAWELNPGERYELIDGAAYAMAAPNTEHQRILTMLIGEFYAFLRGKPCEVFAAPFDVRLFFQEDESDDTVVQPDLTVICDPGKLGDEGCRGAPDLVIEILSPSNTAIEMERKLNCYQEAGVREYWIVDPMNRLIRVYLLKDGRYVPQTLRAAGLARSAVLPGLELPLAEVFA